MNRGSETDTQCICWSSRACHWMFSSSCLPVKFNFIEICSFSLVAPLLHHFRQPGNLALVRTSSTFPSPSLVSLSSLPSHSAFSLPIFPFPLLRFKMEATGTMPTSLTTGMPSTTFPTSTLTGVNPMSTTALSAMTGLPAMPAITDMPSMLSMMSSSCKIDVGHN